MHDMKLTTLKTGEALFALLLALILPASIPGCDDDDDRLNTGAPCDSIADCFPGIEQDSIPGYITCLDLVEGGYCTHTCASDSDCCTVEGECESGVDQVCAPFESAGDHYCFLSCEVQEDGNAYCQEWAHPDFICRSTGGGTDNEKVCVPGG